jgi:hypothetical protein
MALTILPHVDRGPSKSQQTAQALTGLLKQGIEMYGQHQISKQRAAQLAQEDAKLQSHGIDVSGISDPKMRQAYVGAALQGSNAQQLAQFKEQLKQQTIEKQTSQLRERYQQQEPKKMGEKLASGEKQPTTQETRKPFDDLEIAEASVTNPQLARVMQDQNDILIREEREEKKAKEMLEAEERKNRTNKEKAFFKFNEPKLAEIAGTERKIKVDNARFSRLEDLFSDTSKFPHQTLAAFMTKDGQLNDVAYSQLTPEAQEAVKLIIDSTSGIKDTYGARVTNFDLQTYLRKLPSLMTSPEGRSRVLRDLKNINDINSTYNEGIQDIFDKAGGSDKISFSEAERRFKKEYGKELDRKVEKFISPSQTKFDSLPSAKQYLGKKMKNPETGEIFISDGIEWKPFEE